ncbi:chemotaxis protein CheW [Rariglobus hedericola]|uniref:Chemotaxis protein CheW n=1 Tax=Rariglobus hedericola TaxID=2597822 RepID=A0A556QJL9_9BACT|nr:chemotaxis protein CheW [Rariglobus hedericola]TSJ76843.1 chemotaxis protein CheW [Rariglobus hedericola]
MSEESPSTPPNGGGMRRRVVDPEVGARLLDREPPPGYRAEWTAYLSKPPKKAEVTTDSALVFRVGAEWLALPASWVGEVAPVRAVHSVPHRRGRALEGLVNVRGELLPCFSLDGLLGIDAADGVTGSRRLVVAGQGARRLVFRADEVFGVIRYDAARSLPSPGRLRHVKHLLEWKGRTPGLLDAESVWNALERSLA